MKSRHAIRSYIEVRLRTFVMFILGYIFKQVKLTCSEVCHMLSLNQFVFTRFFLWIICVHIDGNYYQTVLYISFLEGETSAIYTLIKIHSRSFIYSAILTWRSNLNMIWTNYSTYQSINLYNTVTVTLVLSSLYV